MPQRQPPPRRARLVVEERRDLVLVRMLVQGEVMSNVLTDEAINARGALTVAPTIGDWNRALARIARDRELPQRCRVLIAHGAHPYPDGAQLLTDLEAAIAPPSTRQ
jgi:hypothetical protein